MTPERTLPRAVPCRFCGAIPNEPCTSRSGKPLRAGHHRARAVRAQAIDWSRKWGLRG